MFFDRLMNQTSAPVLEQMLQFTAARHKLILENIASVDLPGYRQKDLSRRKVPGHAPRRGSSSATTRLPVRSVSTTSAPKSSTPRAGMLAHDGNNRSMEQLQSDMAKNGLMHNMVIELLRKQYAQMDMALKERVA